MTTTRKTEIVNFRLTPADESLFMRAAQAVDETITDFFTESARERAQRVLADRTSFVLDDDAWTAFNRALESPTEVVPELVELFSRPRPD